MAEVVEAAPATAASATEPDLSSNVRCACGGGDVVADVMVGWRSY
jgi:hypothetical protein